mmetsp:Transcript_17272/g.60715  ORF Transcript_17272/g.60715 Transcript_17272/m.60715 type:complete len:320 (-) Transcript_17272:873-1832(-)
MLTRPIVVSHTPSIAAASSANAPRAARPDDNHSLARKANTCCSNAAPCRRSCCRRLALALTSGSSSACFASTACDLLSLAPSLPSPAAFASSVADSLSSGAASGFGRSVPQMWHVLSPSAFSIVHAPQFHGPGGWRGSLGRDGAIGGGRTGGRGFPVPHTSHILAVALFAKVQPGQFQSAGAAGGSGTFSSGGGACLVSGSGAGAAGATGRSVLHTSHLVFAAGFSIVHAVQFQSTSGGGTITAGGCEFGAELLRSRPLSLDSELPVSRLWPHVWHVLSAFWLTTVHNGHAHVASSRSSLPVPAAAAPLGPPAPPAAAV